MWPVRIAGWFRAGVRSSREPEMSIFLVGLILFVGMHSIYILLPGARTAAIARIGYNPWRGL